MKLVKILIGLVVFAYAAYAVILAVEDYLKVATVVGNALENQPRGPGADRAGALRETVVRDTRTAGVPIEDKDVVVTEADRRLRIRATWSHPLVVVRGEVVAAVPVWLERSAPVKE